MTKSKFISTSPTKPKWEGGYSGGSICPSDIADKLFGEEISGPWLTCYMLRRFGWPNIGSDDYKQLMTWAITTPIDGLLLSVTPYLGGSNLHFGILFSRDVGRRIDFDPGREAWFKRHSKAVMGWWRQTGSKLYGWGYGAKDGDPDELVHWFADDNRCPGKGWGLYRRTPEMAGNRGLPKNLAMREWWLEELIKKKHPEIRLPKMLRRERLQRGNPFKRKCELAIRQTMRDLLRPINVRDVEFNIFGGTWREDVSYAKKPKPVLDHVERWPGAGHTPEYWYSDEAKKERAKAKV